MFLFGWGLEFIGWCVGWFLIGTIETLLSIKKLIFVVIYLFIFKMNLKYDWFDAKLEGLIFISIFPIMIIIFGRNRIKKD